MAFNDLDFGESTTITRIQARMLLALGNSIDIKQMGYLFPINNRHIIQRDYICSNRTVGDTIPREYICSNTTMRHTIHSRIRTIFAATELWGKV